MHSDASYLCEACGEQIIVPLDVSAGTQQNYIEDCPVCCRPNLIRVEFDENGIAWISAQAE